MIIPIKCFTCGNVLANKYRYYLDEVRKMKLAQGLEVNKVEYFTKENMDKSVNGIVLDNMRLHNPCCRRHMLTHVDIE
jgi:DNA-directed RNA polymerase I, II, and III subunit RPABC5